ncbi:hypothetical protein AC579_7982 [Pseudocercospora musae]|uniref:Uncharacterized protein n=1 Tax=Pseudocercospora musae TaxID=113226 RepID=A0A139I054_9PEZI|nr:hypothetical protein AC579_7982 [Pseudocercospora musae]
MKVKALSEQANLYDARLWLQQRRLFKSSSTPCAEPIPEQPATNSNNNQGYLKREKEQDPRPSMYDQVATFRPGDVETIHVQEAAREGWRQKQKRDQCDDPAGFRFQDRSLCHALHIVQASQ